MKQIIVRRTPAVRLAQWIGPAAIALLSGISGCGNRTVYRLPSGLTYQVWHRGDGDGVKAGSGSTVKVVVVMRHADSLVGITEGRLPTYQQLIPGLVFPYTTGETLFGAAAGDSLVIRQRVDSMLSKGLLRGLPNGWKRDDEVVTIAVVDRVFPFDPAHGDSVILADKLTEAQRLLATATPAGRRRVGDWLAGRGLTADEMKTGVYRVVDQTGNGDPVDSGTTVELRYRLSTLTGRIVNSNMDTAFRQPPTLEVVLGARRLPDAVDDALRGLRRGSRVRIFVPAATGVDGATVVKMGGVPEDMVWYLELE